MMDLQHYNRVLMVQVLVSSKGSFHRVLEMKVPHCQGIKEVRTLVSL